MMLTSAALLLFNSLAPQLTNHLIAPSPQVSEGYVGLSSAALRQGDDRPMLGVTLGEGATSEEGAWVHGVIEGGPAEQAGLLSGDLIIKVGKKIDADLIVMASHTKRKFVDYVLGPNAEHVVHHAKVSVMIVR